MPFLVVEEWHSHLYSAQAAAGPITLFAALLCLPQQTPKGLPRPDVKRGETQMQT